MSYSKRETFFCSCGCGTQIELTVTTEGDATGIRVIDIPAIIDSYNKEEASSPGDVRPDSLPEGVHAPKGGSGKKA